MDFKDKKILLSPVIIIICFQIIYFLNIPKSKPHNINHLNDIYIINNENRIPIFAYHRIVPKKSKEEYFKNDQWVQSVDDFEKQMKFLSDNNFKTISMDQFYCWYKGDCIFDTKTVMITIDDGNSEDYYFIYPILKKYNLKATSFVVGSRIKSEEIKEYNPDKRSFLTKEMIEEIESGYPNFDIQSHTYNMHTKGKNNKGIMLSMAKSKIKNDFDLNGKGNYKYIASPYGEFNNAFIEEAKEHGYNMAFTFGPYDYAKKTDPQYAIPRIKMNGSSTVELMMSYLKCD